MIAKIKVGNPSYSQNEEGNGYLTFPIHKEQKWSLMQLCKEFKSNKKDLILDLDYESKKRTLQQNALLWAMLTEEAKYLNGGRKDNVQCSAESLYYDAINKYGKDTFLAIKEGCEKELKKVYRRVFTLNKYTLNGEIWINCRCVIGSSKYTSKEMTDLIDGVLDDCAEIGIDTLEMRCLKEEWNGLRTNKKPEKTD